MEKVESKKVNRRKIYYINIAIYQIYLNFYE